MEATGMAADAIDRDYYFQRVRQIDRIIERLDQERSDIFSLIRRGATIERETPDQSTGHVLGVGFLPRLRPRGKVAVRWANGPRLGSKRPIVMDRNEWATLTSREATISELLMEVALRLWEAGGLVISGGLMLDNLRAAGWQTNSTQQHTMMCTYLDQLVKEGRLVKEYIKNRPIYMLPGRQYARPDVAP